MSVKSEKPRMLTIYRSNQSTESDQKAILLNFLPNEAKYTLYYILLTDSTLLPMQYVPPFPAS